MLTRRGFYIGCYVSFVLLALAIVLFVRWWLAPIDIPLPQRPPEPADNAYEVYRSLAAYSEQLFKSQPRLQLAESQLFSNYRLHLDRVEHVKPLLEAMRPVRQEYRRYLDSPCMAILEYDVRWGYPEIREFRRWGRIEALDIALAIGENDFSRALDNYRTVLRLTEQIRYLGGTLHHMAATFIQAMAAGQMAEALHVLPAAECETLVQVTRQWSKVRVPAVQLVHTSRDMHIALLHHLQERQSRFRWMNLRRAAHEATEFYRRVEREIAKPVAQQHHLDLPEHTLNRLFVNDLLIYVRNAAITEARIKLIACAAAVSAYRLKHGTYPESLAKAGVSDLNRDPFTGCEFVYKPTPNGFLLYSVGMDGKDNGGHRVPEGSGFAGDISPIPFRSGFRPQSRSTTGEPVWLK